MPRIVDQLNRTVTERLCARYNTTTHEEYNGGGFKDLTKSGRTDQEPLMDKQGTRKAFGRGS